MASTFKRKEDKGRRGSSYYVSYTDENGVRRTRVAFTDKAASEAFARQLETEARQRRLGLIDPKADRYLQAEQRPLEDHLADFHASLLAKGDKKKYVNQTRTYVRKVLALAKAERLSDLTPSVVQIAIGSLRSGGSSLRTCNAYLRAIKGLTRWLWRDGRTREDALAHLQSFNESTDRRRNRRAFTGEELARLFDAAKNGPVVQGMTGPDRAMLYRLAVGTGFRAGELRSLTPRSFRLEGAPPTVSVAAAYSKRRRDDDQPIRPDLAELIRSWLEAKAEHGPVFKVPEKTAKMLRHDLEAAGIPYRDDSGRVADFHAFRHTYVSMVVQSGASVKVAQELARHSTPTLTIGRYAHASLQDQTAALAALPAIPAGPSAPGLPILDIDAEDDVKGSNRAADAQRSCGEMGQNEAEPGENASVVVPDFGSLKAVLRKGLDAARQDLTASGESAPPRTRTWNPLIKSQLLCQLS